MSSKIFQYTDDSAPTMPNPAQGSLIAVLKAVLVDGYGATPSLGWSVVYEDALNNKIVFQAPEGTRTLIRISDNHIGTTYQYATVQCYESMASMDEGIGPIPSPSYTTYNYISKSSNNSSGNVPWIVIGDGEGFYLLTKHMFLQYGIDNASGYGRIWQPHYLGDYVPWDPTNQHNFVFALQRATTGDNYWYGNHTKHTIARYPHTNEIGSLQAFMTAYMLGYSNVFGSQKQWPSMSPINGRHIYEPIMLWIAAQTNERSNQPLGWMPGLLNGYWSSSQRASNGYGAVTLNECIDVWDTQTTNKVFNFPANYASQPPVHTGGHTSQRFGIIVGEGFRNAY